MSQERDRDGFWSKFWREVTVAVLVILFTGGTPPWWVEALNGDGLFSTSYVPSWLKDKAEIKLKIEEDLWLDGLTQEPEVKLSPSAEGGYTGTGWKIRVVDDKNLIINLESLGAFARDKLDVPIEGSSRWLNAGDKEGTVGLAESIEGENSKWKVKVINKEESEQNIRLEALGDSNDRKWLEGNTDDGTVRLAESGDTKSTQWRVVLR